MQRKAIGLLVLVLVVVAGVVFVELRVDGGTLRGGSASGADDYRVILGGPPPQQRPPAAGDAQASGAPATEPAAAAGEPPRQFRHTVRAGDVLGRVVADHLGSSSAALVARVARASGLADPNDIAPGHVLVIPVERYDRIEVTAGETLEDLASRCYGAGDRTAPLRLVNRDLPDRDDQPLPVGRQLLVPR